MAVQPGHRQPGGVQDACAVRARIHIGQPGVIYAAVDPVGRGAARGP